MIGTLSVKIAAHNPSFPLEPVFTFVNSAQSFRIMNVPRKIGRWDITKVFVNLEYPDTTTVRKECVLNGSVWVGTVDGCATSGTSTNGFIVTASGIDEDGNAVSNYVLGAGDLYVQKLDGSITPDQNAAKMFFYEETPTTPKEGDTTFIQGTLNIWDGTAWTPVAQVPTKVSDLTNDLGFITSSQVAPYHDPMTPEEDTGIAGRAVMLAMRDNVGNLDENGGMDTVVTIQSDLTPALRARLQYLTYWDWNLTKFFEQTYSTAVELKFCYSEIRKRIGFPRPYYTGYMWRTAGLDDDGKGYAIPCSEEGIPDGRFIEINEVTTSFICFNNDAMVHTITGNANWTSIETIDEQSG